MKSTPKYRFLLCSDRGTWRALYTGMNANANKINNDIAETLAELEIKALEQQAEIKALGSLFETLTPALVG